MRKKIILGAMFSFIVISCDRPQPEPKVDAQKEDEVSYASDLPKDAFKIDLNMSPSEDDLALVQKIRQALTSDNTLSYGAKNISIHSRNGIVFIEGHVKTEREKALVAGKIRQMYEVNGMENHLEVLHKQRNL